MVSAVKNNLDKIIEACKKMQVHSLYLFGSGARENDFTKESDLDFLFQFEKDAEGLSISEYDYFDLWFLLEKTTGKKVDLVAEEAVRNSYFKKSMEKDKILIYERN
jgi:predicted nucleotidyltransferase